MKIVAKRLGIGIFWVLAASYAVYGQSDGTNGAPTNPVPYDPGPQSALNLRVKEARDRVSAFKREHQACARSGARVAINRRYYDLDSCRCEKSRSRKFPGQTGALQQQLGLHFERAVTETATAKAVLELTDKCFKRAP